MTTLQRFLDTNIVESSPKRLSRDETWKLLTELVGVQRLSRTDDWALHVVSLLGEWLGYQPLGLELIGRYLAENPDLSLGELLKQLQAQLLKNEAIESSQLSTAQRGVKATFELIWQKLDPMTQRVAEFLSLLAPQIISWQILESVSLQLGWSKVEVNRAKKQLYKWQLIESIESIKDYYKINPLIREFFQSKLDASKHSEKFKRVLIEEMVLIAHQIPDLPTSKDIDTLKEAIPHLIEVTQTLIDVVRDEELLWLCDRIGNFYKGQKLYELAHPWFVKCLYVARTRLGNDHPDVATSLNNLAGLYYAQKRYAQAESLYTQVLKLRKRYLGTHRTEVATTLNNLAGLYYAQGRYDEAELLYLEALQLRKRFLGNKSPDVATTLNNLALVYYVQGRYTEAETLYLEALDLRKSLLGNHHFDVAMTLNNLASLYDAQGHYQEAKTLLLQALEVSEQVLGNNHANTIIFRKNLTTLQGKLKMCSFGLPQKLRKKMLTFVPRRKL